VIQGIRAACDYQTGAACAGRCSDCIGCAACIDVCNGVMDKMRYPRGLIRYATENGMARHWTQRQMLARVLRPRVLIYGAVLLAIATALLASLGARESFKVDVVRDRASLARIVADGRIENVYRLQLMNATEMTQRYRVQVLGLSGAHIAGIDEVEVGPAQARWFAVAVQLPYAAARDAKPGIHPIRFEIDRLAARGGDARVVEKSTFVIPR